MTNRHERRANEAQQRKQEDSAIARLRAENQNLRAENAGIRREYNTLYQKIEAATVEEDQFIAKMHRLTQADSHLMYVMERFDSLVLLAEGNAQRDGIEHYSRGIKELRNAFIAACEQTGESAEYLNGQRIEMARQRIELAARMVNGDESALIELTEITKQADVYMGTIAESLARERQARIDELARQAEEAEQQAKLARQEAENKGLSPEHIDAKRRNGLIKYGMIQTWVHDEYKDKKAPAARYLITILKRNAANLNLDEAEVLRELELARGGSRFDQRLQEIMADKVEVVEWQEPRTVAI